MSAFRLLFVEVETDVARRTRLYEEWVNMELVGDAASYQHAVAIVGELLKLGCVSRQRRWCHDLLLPLRPAHQDSARLMSGETPT